MNLGLRKQLGVAVLGLWLGTNVLLLASVGDNTVTLLTALAVGVVAALAGQALVKTYRVNRQSMGFRVLAATPQFVKGNHSSRRLNALLNRQQSETTYLEIGLAAGATFEAVQADNRVGVEPVPRFDVSNLPPGMTVFVATSDYFFEFLTPDAEFDVAFVDGLHTLQQAYLDVMNTLAHLHEGGVILIDDVVPSDEVSAIPSQSRSLDERRSRGLQGSPWHGDVFRLIPLFRDHYPQLEYRTIVGSGNEQAVVWWPDRSSSLTRLDASVVDAYADYTYGQVFGEGIPEYFHPTVEDEIIEEIGQ